MSQKNWDMWAKSLHKWQLHQFTATFLEALGPVNLVLAQCIYISQPVLSFFIPNEKSKIFADTLENPTETALLIKALRTYTPKSE